MDFKKGALTMGLGLAILLFETWIVTSLGAELQPQIPWIMIHMFLICKLFNRGKRLLALIWLPIYWPLTFATGFIAGFVGIQFMPPEQVIKMGIGIGWTIRIVGNLALIYLIWWKYDKEEPRTGKNEHIRYFKGGRRL